MSSQKGKCLETQLLEGAGTTHRLLEPGLKVLLPILREKKIVETWPKENARHLIINARAQVSESNVGMWSFKLLNKSPSY